MAATLAAAGLNIHVSKVSDSGNTPLINACNTVSPDSITAATLLAAAAAHAAATVTSARRPNSVEKSKADHKKYDGQLHDGDRNTEVSGNEDEDDTECILNVEKSDIEDTVTNTAVTPPLHVNERDGYGDTAEDTDNITDKKSLCNETESTSSSLSNGTDKHRRKRGNKI